MTAIKIIAIISAIIVMSGMFTACRTNTEIVEPLNKTTSLYVKHISKASESHQQSTTIHKDSTEAEDTAKVTVSESTTKSKTTAATRKSINAAKQPHTITTTQKAKIFQKETTAAKQTTTKKETTARKETTAKAKSRCTNNNNHSLDCGNMGKWFSSKSDLKAYASGVMESYNSKYENGEITCDEYVKKCPCGYETWL